MLENEAKIVVGWREWVGLPDLKIRAIRAKVDTGALTSAIHAENIKVYRTPTGERKVKFSVQLTRDGKHPKAKSIRCRALVVGRKMITSSNGARENRWIVCTTLKMAGREWPIQLSLSSRAEMQHRVLLGREAVRRHCLIEPGRSFLLER
jgi:hypothetical protein